MNSSPTSRQIGLRLLTAAVKDTLSCIVKWHDRLLLSPASFCIQTAMFHWSFTDSVVHNGLPTQLHSHDMTLDAFLLMSTAVQENVRNKAQKRKVSFYWILKRKKFKNIKHNSYKRALVRIIPPSLAMLCRVGGN